jgi:hypothetical protein
LQRHGLDPKTKYPPVKYSGVLLQENSIKHTIEPQTSGKEYESLVNSIYCGKEEAWNRLMDLSSKGDKIAMGIQMIIYNLGIYRNQKNLEEAKEIADLVVPWLLQETNNLAMDKSVLPIVMWILGNCYRHGIYVAEDEKKAFQCFKQGEEG